MYGGVPPSTGFGTQGRLLQQLALDAHAPPGCTHVDPEQRGTPTESGWQVSCTSQLPLQQSHEALQDIVLSLQTSPSGLQPCGLRQTPTVFGGVMSHVTGVPEPPGRPVEPQQSPSFVHRSPTGWQPLAGWQTSTCVGPYGAQRRLQQEPPHAGSPASGASVAPPAQSAPSGSPQFAAPAGGVPHVPSAFVPVLVQMPPQHCSPVAHASPSCPHHDEALQCPPEQSFEQQSAPVEQALPRVLQVVLRGVHVPLVQVPLQHEALDVHFMPSEMHAGRLHTPLVHVPEQHSLALLHAPPTWKHPGPPSPNPLLPMPELVPVLVEGWAPVPVAPLPAPP
jgi:hypothetical protein